MQNLRLDTSDQLQVYRFNNGIKLLNPKFLKKMINSHIPLHKTVACLLQLPFSIYFENTEGVIQKLNENNVEMLGFDSIKNARGKNYFSQLDTKTAQRILENDRNVLRSKEMKFYEEDVLQEDGTLYHSFSIKMPWYNVEDKIIGLFGVSIVAHKNSLTESLELIAKLGLLNSTQYSHFHSNPHKPLPKQQRLCAHFLLLGMTYKEIGKQLNLSPRTVETYVENLKAKFKCRNRVELIVKLCEISLQQ